jgi:hypothetical protein
MSNHSDIAIRTAKHRVSLKRALRRKYIPFTNTMSTKNLLRLIKLFNISID